MAWTPETKGSVPVKNLAYRYSTGKHAMRDALTLVATLVHTGGLVTGEAPRGGA